MLWATLFFLAASLYSSICSSHKIHNMLSVRQQFNQKRYAYVWPKNSNLAAVYVWQTQNPRWNSRAEKFWANLLSPSSSGQQKDILKMYVFPIAFYQLRQWANIAKGLQLIMTVLIQRLINIYFHVMNPYLSLRVINLGRWFIFLLLTCLTSPKIKRSQPRSAHCEYEPRFRNKLCQVAISSCDSFR